MTDREKYMRLSIQQPLILFSLYKICKCDYIIESAKYRY
jgi:hypothetical protein